MPVLSATLTEGKHAEEFIMEEFGQPNHCREVGTVTSGQNLVDGQLVQLTASKLVAKATTLNTAGSAFVVPIEGIIIGNWNASSTGPWGAADILNVPYMKRGPAIVRDESLTYPAGGSQKTVAIAYLKSVGIIVRGAKANGGI